MLHVSAGAKTTERPPTYDFGGGSAHVTVCEPQPLYPVIGLILHGEWQYAPVRRAFLDDGDGNEDVLDEFEETSSNWPQEVPSSACASSSAAFPVLGTWPPRRVTSSSSPR